MQHPVDGRAWKNFDTKYPDFAAEPRNVRLGLAVMVSIRSATLIGLRSVNRFDAQELKKVIWYVLHNSPEIDTYRAKFKSEFPDNDMKEDSRHGLGSNHTSNGCHVDNDPGVSESSELFALAYGPSQTPISVNSCVVNGVRFVMHSRDEHCTTQNSGICSPGPDREMYYGQLEQILEFSYLPFKIVLFRVKWFDTSNKRRMKNLVIRNNITQIKANGEAFKNDQYIHTTQVKQCFYLEDMARRPLGWKVVEHVSHKKFLNGGVIVVEDDPDVIHVDNSSDLALSTSPSPHELADFDNEDSSTLILLMECQQMLHGVMAVMVAVMIVPLNTHIPTGCGGCLGNRGKGTRNPNLGGRRAGMQHTRQET
ncbi:RNA-directed DNA polymerase, eukaryota [Tanacetum coccineum]|uniref:RNA-directed DNA polymerase, eukaryota n=1 Tax=Tanacetum coccineum TaxID=301880 RepID=A0ABQ5HM04_9ASTR